MNANAVLSLLKTENLLFFPISTQNHAVFWQKKRHHSAKPAIF